MGLLSSSGGFGPADVACHLVCSGHWMTFMRQLSSGVAGCCCCCGWKRKSLADVRTAKVGPWAGAKGTGGRGPAGGARECVRWVRGG